MLVRTRDKGSSSTKSVCMYNLPGDKISFDGRKWNRGHHLLPKFGSNWAASGALCSISCHQSLFRHPVEFNFKQDGIIVRDHRGPDIKKFKVLDGTFKGSF